RIGLIMLAIIVSGLIFGCAVYEIGGQLKGKEYVVYTDPNGLDKVTYKFDNKGTGGTFEYVSYSFGQADATATTYDKHTWYQTWGLKGTFTYDNKTKTEVDTYTHEYQLKLTATTAYAADYEWYEIKSTDNDYVQTNTYTNIFTQDGAFFLYKADGENSWTAIDNYTYVGGAYSNSSYTYKITEGTINYTRIRTKNDNLTAAQTADNTQNTSWVYTYTVKKVLLAGKDTEGLKFDTIWKKGNTVNFKYDRTSYIYQNYIGTTNEATAPSADEIAAGNGVDTNVSGTDTYTIDATQDNLSERSFVHAGDYIYDAYWTVYPMKSIK
ncbi:MAG: hypothetical protein AB1798_19280, partial [Spirochaetota bacterium]